MCWESHTPRRSWTLLHYRSNNPLLLVVLVFLILSAVLDAAAAAGSSAPAGDLSSTNNNNNNNNNNGGGGSGSGVNHLICTCRCCYRGGCTTVANSSWPVSSCGECTTASCNAFLTSSAVREDTARIFDSIRAENEVIDDVVLEECTILSVLEFATCSSRSCKRTTTIKADCFNRDSFLTKYTIVSFVCITAIAVVFGLIKNHIPAFQTLNEKYFNY